MRTVSQLSKLTGINRRTIQYYATEKRPGKSGEGAGVITPCLITDNGYRYFDDDALFELLAIKTLKQCGYGPDDIRRLIDSNEFDIVESANLQIEALERAKREIDQQIQFVNILKALATADYDNDEEEALAVVSSLFLKLFIMSTEQVLRRSDPEFVFDANDDDFQKALKDEKMSAKAEIFASSLGMMDYVGKGDVESAVEVMPPEVKHTLADDYEQEDAFSEFVAGIMGLFEEGASPRCKEARNHAARVFEEACPERKLAQLGALSRFVRELMEGTYIAILAELLCGEGFAAYVAKVFESYYATAKRQVAKSKGAS